MSTSNEFTVFKRFKTKSEAEAFQLLLNEKGIASELVDNSYAVDLSFSGDTSNDETQVFIHQSDFEAAKEVVKQDALHKQFVNGGIEQGVLNLTERITTETTILAFSVGGTIAWQCALNSPYVKKLVCVSSTRLRKEEEKPACETVLIFGEQDEFAPKKAWFEKMEVTPKVIPMMPHDMYKEMEVAQLVAAML